MRRNLVSMSNAALTVWVAILLTGCSYANDKNIQATEDKNEQITVENTVICKEIQDERQTEAENDGEQQTESENDGEHHRDERQTEAENDGEQQRDERQTEAENDGEQQRDERQTEAENDGEQQGDERQTEAENDGEQQGDELQTEVYLEWEKPSYGEEVTESSYDNTEIYIDTSLVQLQNKDNFDYYMAEQIVKMVNAERERLNLKPLVMDYRLQEASDIRAVEITMNFSHTRPDGTECISAINQVGVSYGYAGENIATGYYSADSVFEAWMESEGHYANIICPNYTRIAVSCYYDPASYGGYNWVQLFISD